MKVILLSVFLCSCRIAYCHKKSFISLPALKMTHHIGISERYISEIQCIKKLDAAVKTRWAQELNEFPTTDLRNLTKIPWADQESRYTKYNSLEDEWLMEEGSPIEKINECVQYILSDVAIPADSQGSLGCIDELLSTNSYEEVDHGRDFENFVNISIDAQLPFRKFISFPEVEELIFQNRDPHTWTSLESLLFAHTKSYVLTDTDKVRRNYIVSQNCDWINLKALQDAPNEAARINEFTLQVRHSVNKQLAGMLVRNWNLEMVLPNETYNLWLESRQEMMSNLGREVEILRKQNRDVQWLCEYATELATNFTEVQSDILLTGEKSSVHLEASDIASMARTIELALAKVNDTRHNAIKIIADKQDDGTRCLTSLVRLIQNHRRYELASAFIDEEYRFPEMYCVNTIKNPGLIRFTFCNCIGSFCIAHYLAALFAEEYVLVKGSNDIHKIVRSGIRSKRKVRHCHTLANSSKN